MRGWFRERYPEWGPEQEDPPQRFLEGRPSLLAALDVPFKAFFTVVALVLPVVLTTAAFTGDPVAALARMRPWELLQIAPAFLLAFAPAVRLAFTRYHIDEDGVRITSQVLARNESRVSWEKVTAIRHRITLIDRLLGVQRVDIVAYGERGTTLSLVGMRNAELLRDLAAVRMREHTTIGGLFRSD